MNIIQKNIISYIRKHPIQSSVLGIFMGFAVVGGGIFAQHLIVPENAEACCVIPTPPTPPPLPPPPPVVPTPPPPVVVPPIPPGDDGEPEAIECTLTVSPDRITAPDEVTLTWTTENADDARINGGGIGDVALNGSQTHPLGRGAVGKTITFTLVATNDEGGRVTCSDNVVVEGEDEPPVEEDPVCTLTVSPGRIQAPGDVTLTWTTENAVSARFTNANIGSVALNGSMEQRLGRAAEGTYTYVLVAEDADGDTVTCRDSVVVTQEPPVEEDPVCTLTVSPGRIQAPGDVTLTWTTENAVSARFTNARIGSVALDGSMTRSFGSNAEGTYTYTLIATDDDGDTVTCQDSVVITQEPVDDVPVCTLSANPTSITTGGSSTLTWTTENATSVSINQGIGSVALDGSQVVSPNVNTTYTLTARDGDGDTVTCTARITIQDIPVDDRPVCTLSANPTLIDDTESSTLIWTTRNAETVRINQGIGSVALNGSRSVSPNTTTTYTLTARDDDGDTVTCVATITVQEEPDDLVCSLDINKSEIEPGESATLTWTTRNADEFSIDRGIGEVTPTSGGSITISPDDEGSYTYIGTAEDDDGNTVTCSDVIRVEDDDDCCGGRPKDPEPSITIDSLARPGDSPLAFVTLSQLPYTGIEMGPFGAFMYWALLILWSGALAYLVLFKFIPWTGGRVRAAGSAFNDALTSEYYMEHSEKEEELLQESVVTRQAMTTRDRGFESLKQEDGSLTVDDIVKGLNRATAAQEEPYVSKAEEVYEEAPVVAPRGSVSSDTTAGFLNALMAGDRDSTFGTLRRAQRAGESAEAIIGNALVMLDEAYRARVEGGSCNEDVKRICASVDTMLLEQVIDALASAVDTTYSKAQTGAKMALTRAHAIID